MPEYLAWMIILRGRESTLCSSSDGTQCCLESYLPISVDCHFPLIIVCIAEERQTNLLSFFFPFLLSLYTSPHMPLPPEFKAMKKSLDRKVVRTKWFIHTKVVKPSRLPHQHVSKCLNSGLAFRKSYSYITSVWISCQKKPTELHNGHRVWDSPHYKLRSLRSYISARYSGLQEGKKIWDIGKNPHKVTSVFRD